MIFFIFLIGLAVGSFLNVLIDRLAHNESILGRSHCDKCKKTLAWYDLIPLLSFFVLGRKCRYCKKKLSFQYPIIEFVTGVLFVFTFFYIYPSVFTEKFLFSFVFHLILLSGLITIFVADFKYRIIPDEILVVLIGATLLFKGLYYFEALTISLLCGVILFLIFLTLVLITRGKGMGMGDVKYVFFMGFLLGYPSTIVAFYVAFLTGAVVSIILIFAGRKRFGQTIAFGPFLVFATLVAYVWGERLWELFKRIIGL